MPEGAKSIRFLFVDGLRGLASLSVALFHIGRDFLDIDALFYGYHGIIVFFVLSGFVICHSITGKTVNLRFVADFALRRAVRLDPSYWVAIALTLFFTAFPAYILGYYVELPSISAIAHHMVYLQTLMGIDAINVVFWTLCYEVQFYLVFCILMYISCKFSDVIKTSPSQMHACFFAGFFLFSTLWPLQLHNQITEGLFVDLWYLFLLGAFARWAVESSWAKISLGIVISLLFVQFYRHGNLAIVIGSITSLLLYWSLRYNKMQSWLTWRWVQYFGMISYSLYLAHDIVGLYVRDTGLHLTNKYFGIASSAGNYFWCAIALLFSVISAHVLYKFVELPSHTLSRRVDLSKLHHALKRVLGRINDKKSV